MRNPRDTTIKCPNCGGKLRKAVLAHYDFTAYAGLPFSVTVKNAPGLRCAKCKEQMLPGEMISMLLTRLGLDLCRMPFLLPGVVIRHLRRSLGFSQEQLADKLVVHRVTLSRWENGAEPISPAFDMTIRALVLAAIFQKSPAEVLAQMRASMASVLGNVRSASPPQPPPPLEIDATEFAAA